MNRRKPCCSSSSEEACESFSNPQQYSKAFDRDDCVFPFQGPFLDWLVSFAGFKPLNGQRI